MKSIGNARVPACVVWLLALTAIPSAPATGQTNSAYVPLRADGNGIAALSSRVRLELNDVPLVEALREIMREADLELVFATDLAGLDRPVSLRAGASAADALLRVLEGSQLEVLVSPAGQAVLVRRGARDSHPDARPARITGIVREAASGAPIAEAEVIVEGTRLRATTDRLGRYVIDDVPTGFHTILAVRFSYQDARVTEVSVAPDGETAIDIAMTAAPAQLASVVVSPGVFGVMRETATPRQALTRNEIETQPQIADDIFHAISRLPGVSKIDMSAPFGVRGSSNAEVLLRLDGLELIEPYHIKDFDDAISIVDIDAIGGVDISTGGFGAQHGNRLSGIFDMRTASVPPGPPRTSLGLSLTNARFASRGSFAGDRGRWLVSARRGYLDLVLELTDLSDDLSPVYYDGLAKVEYQPAPGLLVSGHLLHARDDLRYRSDDDDPDLDSNYGSTYVWLNMDAEIGSRVATGTVLAIGDLDWERRGVRERDMLVGALSVDDAHTYGFASLRQDLQVDWSSLLLTRAGVELRKHDADYGYSSWIEYHQVEDGTRFIVTDTTVVAATPEGTSVSAWLSQRVRPWPSLTLEAGIRWDRHTHAGDAGLDPRLAAALTIGPRTTLRAAWGRYTQPHALHRLQIRDGVTSFNDTEHAEHRVVGLEHTTGGGVSVRFEAYDIALTELQPRFVSLDNRSDVFPELSPERESIDPDDGRARGVELMVGHRQAKGLEWGASYALSVAEERIDGIWTPRPRDQRQALGLDVSYRLDRWRFAAAWQIHSGWPRTPASMRADTVGTDVFYSPVYGDYNTARLPAYHRLDLRVFREFPTRRGRVALYIDIFNAYDRENARALVPRVRRFDNAEPTFGYDIDRLLPRLPSFGLTWEF